ncbi:uncharacterized protein LOC121853385 [Homarus americanus]|uniref:uncharacterized protein LOC121853385 n=1 Tax=Homarus americanus TaxID=6706 RepID=UPI001C461014|nr:uncharacterized protein LOC121853385 [Homarus americanus]
MSDPEKMHILLQACSEEIRDHLYSYSTVENGFQRALKALRIRFGGEDAFIREQIQDLMLTSSVLDNLLGKELLVEKLPSHLSEKYRSKVEEFEAQGEKEPGLEHLWGFIQKAADAGNAREAYTETWGARDRRYAGNNASRRAVGLAVTGAERKACSLCSDDHILNRCHKFRTMAVFERTRTVQRLRYCFLCLRKGHQVNACPMGYSPCDIDGCSELHSRWLHPSPKSMQRERCGNRRQSQETDKSKCRDRDERTRDTCDY